MRAMKFTRINGIKVADSVMESRNAHCFASFSRPFIIGKTTFVVADCHCGSVGIVSVPHVRSGHTTSCGCVHNRKTGDMARIHGMYGTPMHGKWAAIKQRCLDPNCRSFERYGARGITMCDRWMNSLQSFIDDMGECPGPGYSIERIDNLKGYSPENCKWATRREQCNNRRSNVNVTLYQQTKTITEWSRISLVPAEAIRRRLIRGWVPSRAVFFMDDKMTKRATEGVSHDGE